MFKKTVAAIVTSAICLTLLAGCGESSQPQASSNPEAAQDTGNETAGGETESGKAQSGAEPAAEAERGEPIELKFFSLNGDYSTAKGEEALAAVEDAIWNDLGINCKINMITSDSFSNDQIAVKIAAGELDAISSNMPLTGWQNFIEKGMLLPLDEMLEAEGQDLLEQVDPKLWDPYRGADGKLYLIPIQSPVPFYCGTWLRMDLFRKYGIEKVPETVEELVEGLKVVCGNEPDLIGMTAGHISWIFNSGPLNFHLVDADKNQTLTNASGDAMVKCITNGEMYIPVYWEEEDFRKSLERSVELYASGILDPEIFTTTFDHANQLVAADRVVCLGEGYGFQATADRKAGLDPDFPVDEDKKQEWVFLTGLTNEINGGATTWQYGYETGMFIGIVSTTKYPEEVMKILNWICASNENYALACWGVEGKHWNYTQDGKVEFVTDDSGNRVVNGGLGGMEGNLRSDWWVPLTESFYGNEWEKIFAERPTTATWTNCDGFINYQYETDATTRSDMETIAGETIVNIITGKVGLEDGLDKMTEQLDRAGYADYYAEKNAQYCEGMGIK